MKFKRRTWITVAALAALTATVATLWLVRAQRFDSRARRQWKDNAIKRINERVSDSAWLNAEIARLKQSQRYMGGWFSDDLLLLANGDWIACQSVCTKQREFGVEKDLFIGRGSDGKWYYSTFHFCVRKIVLQPERQPDTLAQFIDGYWLAPFDGKSNDCLKLTWDGGPYGDFKLQAARADGDR